MKQEYILCAAIWYQEYDTESYTAKNIERGIVVCGHRHDNVIATMKALANLRTVTFGEDSVGRHTQGFLTNENRFVDRWEAAKIASKSGQIRGGITKLYSEDLY